jgi:hypothetical protein
MYLEMSADGMLVFTDRVISKEMSRAGDVGYTSMYVVRSMERVNNTVSTTEVMICDDGYQLVGKFSDTIHCTIPVFVYSDHGNTTKGFNQSS